MITVQGGHLKTGNVSSCKCLARKLTSERSTKHGASKTPEYLSWQQMKERCLNQSGKDYKRYGARGITVHPVWIDSFETFLAHIGPRPHGFKSVDRIDNAKGYEPGNVRWATPSMQARNTRTNKLTEDVVRNIKTLHSNGLREYEIVQILGLRQQLVNSVLNGKLWKDVQQ